MTVEGDLPRLSYVVPVHNQVTVLDTTVRALVDRLRRHPGSEVILVENGSTDGSADLVVALAKADAWGPVRVVATASATGMGWALRLGMELAAGDLTVLTAADLPFGFSDLEQALELRPRPALVIGSKAHPHSQIRRTLGRGVLSWGFRLTRRLLLGLDVGDSQGTIIIDSRLAKRVLPNLRSGDFFISTEVIAVAASLGVMPVEVPIVYRPSPGQSTVSPLRDARRMAVATWRLRRRLEIERVSPAARAPEPRTGNSRSQQ